MQSDPALRVLIVEDDDENAHSIGDVFESMGYEVHLAHNGPVALEVARRCKPDLVILDIRLPVIDGWEVGRRLRELIGNVPMIAITGFIEELSEQRSAAEGFLAHLHKPLDVEKLRECLNRTANAPSS